MSTATNFTHGIGTWQRSKDARFERMANLARIAAEHGPDVIDIIRVDESGMWAEVEGAVSRRPGATLGGFARSLYGSGGVLRRIDAGVYLVIKPAPQQGAGREPSGPAHLSTEAMARRGNPQAARAQGNAQGLNSLGHSA